MMHLSVLVDFVDIYIGTGPEASGTVREKWLFRQPERDCRIIEAWHIIPT
jgi:hypothetical protein